MDEGDQGIGWLLQSKDTSVRYLTLTDLLDEPPESSRAARLRKEIVRGPRVKKLLAGQRADGGFGVHPYQKWTGAHWRLVSLVELGIPVGNRRAVAAANQVLRWLGGSAFHSSIVEINGLTRRHASMEGNAVAVCSRLGLARDERVAALANSLIEWQWPDGGWNCDTRPEADHSSFYESLSPLWGLTEYHKASADREALRTAEKTAELFLRHRMFRAESTGEVIKSEWLKLHYPLYWHYDVLQGLLMLSRLDGLADSRTKEALDIIESKRLPNGCWRPGGYYWYPPGKKKSNLEVVDWGRSGPNEMITLNSLRVLKSSGRL